MQIAIRLRILLITCPFIILTACHSDSISTSKYALRDSVTANYISTTDTSGQIDTSNFEYKILKAYISNDTTFFSQLQKDIERQRSDRENWDLWNSDIPLPKVEDLDADEAYRFIYSILASPSYDIVTISKRKDSSMLSYVHLNRDDIGNTPPIITTKESKYLNARQWDELIRRLNHGDFWGLEKENNKRMTDGNDLTVIGYRKGLNGVTREYNFVHRFWSSTLNDAYFYVYFDLLSKKHRPIK